MAPGQLGGAGRHTGTGDRPHAGEHGLWSSARISLRRRSINSFVLQGRAGAGGGWAVFFFFCRLFTFFSSANEAKKPQNHEKKQPTNHEKYGFFTQQFPFVSSVCVCGGGRLYIGFYVYWRGAGGLCGRAWASFSLCFLKSWPLGVGGGGFLSHVFLAWFRFLLNSREGANSRRLGSPIVQTMVQKGGARTGAQRPAPVRRASREPCPREPPSPGLSVSCNRSRGLHFSQVSHRN